MEANSEFRTGFTVKPEHSRDEPFYRAQDLVQLISLKDRSTFEHSNRVYQLTHQWVSYMRSRWQWLEIDIAALEVSALLHDVGKIGVLDEILNKPSALTPVERDHLEQHSEIGFHLVREFPEMDDVARGVRHHHERWDGKGYPLGLKESAIPVFSQIIAIVDAFDAMTSERPYRAARSTQWALQEIRKEAGRQFNPELVDQFLAFAHSQNT